MRIDKGNDKYRKGFEFILIKRDGVIGVFRPYIYFEIKIWAYYIAITKFLGK